MHNIYISCKRHIKYVSFSVAIIWNFLSPEYSNERYYLRNIYNRKMLYLSKHHIGNSSTISSNYTSLSSPAHFIYYSDIYMFSLSIIYNIKNVEKWKYKFLLLSKELGICEYPKEAV